jgi:hypothetical protein
MYHSLANSTKMANHIFIIQHTTPGEKFGWEGESAAGLRFIFTPAHEDAADSDGSSVPPTPSTTVLLSPVPIPSGRIFNDGLLFI